MTCTRKIGPFDCCSVVQGDCLELMKHLPDFPCECGVDAEGEGGIYHVAGGHSLLELAIVTDPPYGIGFAGQPTKWSRDNIQRIAEKWDNESPDINMLTRFPADVMVWGGNHFPLPPSRGWLVWTKPPGLPSYGTSELCWTNIEMPVRHLECERCHGDKWNHPTQKPLRLMEWCLGFTEADIIIDPFAGSGTTLVAAKKLGRHFLGFEISEAYCQIARERLARIDAQPNLFQPKAEQMVLA